MKRLSWLAAAAVCAGMLPLAGCEKKVESPTASLTAEKDAVKHDDKAKATLPPPPTGK